VASRSSARVRRERGRLPAQSARRAVAIRRQPLSFGLLAQLGRVGSSKNAADVGIRHHDLD
jgi:hypothetical protein